MIIFATIRLAVKFVGFVTFHLLSFVCWTRFLFGDGNFTRAPGVGWLIFDPVGNYKCTGCFYTTSALLSSSLYAFEYSSYIDKD